MKKIDPGESELIKEKKNLTKVLSKYESQRKEAGSPMPKSVKSRMEELKLRLAWVLLDLGEYHEGLLLYKELSWQRYGERKYTGISRACIELEEYGEAAKVLAKGLKRYPDSVPLLVARGLLTRRLGDSHDALKDFDRALALNPDERHARFDKALSLSDLGAVHESSEILTQLVQEYPDDPAYRLELGFTMLNLGYPSDAVTHYQGVLNLGYQSPGVFGGLFCAYSELGMKTDALQIATEGVQRFPDGHPGLYENLGEAYQGFGWLDEARDIIRTGLGKFPDDEKLKRLMKDIDDDEKDTGKNGKLRLAGVCLYLTLLLKRLSRYRACVLRIRLLRTFTTLLTNSYEKG